MMQIFLFLKILVLSFIESVTEFLPISSTTHLIFIDHFLISGFINDQFFMVIIQLGSLFALFFYYKKDILDIFKNTISLKKEGYIVVFNLFNAFLASAILGFVLKAYLHFENNLKVAFYSLIFFGILMILIGKKEKTGMVDQLYRISPLNSFLIGVSQVLSMVPGVSRLGITLLTGLFFNLTKENAIKFSFLLGLPTMFSASFFEFGKLVWKNQVQTENLKYYIASFLFSFIFSSVLIKLLLKLLHQIPLKFFGYYRIFFAVLIALLFLI